MLGRKALGTVAYLGGVPAVLERFTWSWGQMVQYNHELFVGHDATRYVHYDRSTISDHAPARNGLVARFLGDWLVQMDTDHQFEPDVIRRLVETADRYGVDVLSAVYQLKQAPHVPVLYQWVKVSADGPLGLQPMARWPTDAALVQIGSAGAGCLFVRRSVFDRLATAYPGVGAFDRVGLFSEDHSFFLRCREHEIKCYAAMQIHSHHLRVVPVTLEDLDDRGLQVSELFPVEGFAHV